jgi:hypothetical protein
MTFVIKSEEWSTKCKHDAITFTMNGKSLINPTGGSVSVCNIPKLAKDSQFQHNWSYDGDEHHAVWTGPPEDRDSPSCPNYASLTRKGRRYDFVIGLKDSGDGKDSTTMYIGKKSIDIVYCD